MTIKKVCVLLVFLCLISCKEKKKEFVNYRPPINLNDYVFLEDSSLVHKKDLQISKNLDRLCHQVFKSKHFCSENLRYSLNLRIRSLGISKIPTEKLVAFIKEIQELDSLYTLSLEKIPLETLPSLSKLTHLTSLSLIQLSLTDTVVIPQYLKRLKHLDIINSKLKHIIFPKDCQIRNLRLYRNEINYLNDSFYHLKHLENLHLSRNPLFDVIDLNRFPKLKKVNLCGTATRPHIRERIKKRYPHIEFDFCPDEIEVVFEDDEKVKQ